MKLDAKSTIEAGKAILGIELGSTRIKAVLIDQENKPIAQGSHTWENQLVDGLWTYSVEAVWYGLQDCYADLRTNVKSLYDTEIETLAAIGVSAMMHGYMAFNEKEEILVPFRTWRNTNTGQAAAALSELFVYNIPLRWSISHLYQAILDNEEHVPSINYLTTLAGFVNIVGNPNVGKSTLMNALVGERISIATFKAQTTRHRIMGIYNTDEMQIVFSDTPGVLKPNYKLQESMLNFSTSALTDADILLYVTDVVETPDKNNEFMEKVRQMTVPVLLLINKIDLTDQEKLVKLVEEWKELLPQAEIIPISAASKFNVDYVMKRIKELLPDSPPYFGKDQWTDKPARFFVNEIIREKILLYYDKEIPYSVEVAVEEFKEEAKKIHIRAVIYVERDSQKGIIIGKQGKALKKVATEARRELERFFGKTIYLETYVKVDKDWRSSDKELRNFGYQLD